MKFTDGYWLPQPGTTILRPRDVADVQVGDDTLTVWSSTAPLTSRGDTLNRPLVTVTFTSPMDDVVGVRIEHFQGGVDRGPHFALATEPAAVKVSPGGEEGVATFSAGSLTAKVRTEGEWSVDFEGDGRHLTSSTPRSIGVVTDARGDHYVHEQLTLGVGP